MYLSTLRSYIEAMGGELEIVARFPDHVVRITQFELLDPEQRPQRCGTARKPRGLPPSSLNSLLHSERGVTSTTGSASNGLSRWSGSVLSWTSTLLVPTKKLLEPATSRL